MSIIQLFYKWEEVLGVINTPIILGNKHIFSVPILDDDYDDSYYVCLFFVLFFAIVIALFHPNLKLIITLCLLFVSKKIHTGLPLAAIF